MLCSLIIPQNMSTANISKRTFNRLFGWTNYWPTRYYISSSRSTSMNTVSLHAPHTRFRAFSASRVLRLSSAIGIALNGALWVLVLWRVRGLPDTIPLHYTIYFGIDLLGAWYQMFFLPALGLSIWLLNGGLAVALVLRDRFLAHFLIHGSTVIQLILLLAGVTLVYLNTATL